MEQIILLSVTLLLLCLGRSLSKFPPPYPSDRQRELSGMGIHTISGYRSSRSLKNESSWIFANTYLGILLVWVSLGELLILLIFFVLTSFLIPMFPAFPLEIVFLVLGVILSVVLTEAKLKKRFL